MSQERIWLIKSSTRILGPYSFEEVETLLRNRAVSSTDEARTPEVRWRFFKDRPEFKNILKEISLESENEMTQAGVNFNDSLTPTASIDNASLRVLKPFESAKVETKESVKKESSDSKLHKPQIEENLKIPAYGINIGNQAAQKVNRATVWVWVLFILMTTLVGTLMFLKKHKAVVVKNPYDHYLDLSLKAREAGLYERALQMAKKAASVQELETSFKWKMAPLYITQDNETLKGRKLIEEIMGEPDPNVIKLTPNEITEGYIGIGLSYLLEKNYKNAQEVFEKVLSIDPQNQYGFINLGYTFLEMGEFKKAVEVFEKNESPQAQIGSILANLEIYKSEKKIESFTAALEKSRLLLKLNPIEFRSKVYFLNSLLESILMKPEDKLVRKPEVIQDYAQKTFDEIFQDSEEYSFSYLIYQEGHRWNKFVTYCNELIPTTEDNPHIKAIQSFCYYKANKEVEAFKLIEDALRQLPNDQILQGYQAFLLNAMGKDFEASAILKLNPNSQFKIFNFVQGQICYVKKDLICAESQWRKILEKDSNNLAAMSGVIQVLFDQKKLPQAQEVVARGMSVSARYKPLLELKTLF